MCVAIREEHRAELSNIRRLNLHVAVDFDSYNEALVKSILTSVKKNDVQILLEVWPKFQAAYAAKDEAHQRLWSRLGELYPESNDGDWTINWEQWQLHRGSSAQALSSLLGTLLKSRTPHSPTAA